MKVAWISPVCPSPPTDGNRQRNFFLLRALATRHDVTLICPEGSEEGRQVLSRLCASLVMVSEPITRSFASRVRRRSHLTLRALPPFVPSAIAQMTAAARALSNGPFDVAFGGLSVSPAVLAVRSRIAVIDDQNVESRLYRSLYEAEPLARRRLTRFLDWRAVERFEPAMLRRATAVTVCSEPDARELAMSAALRRVLVVRNGVQLIADPNGGDRDRALVVFVGSMAHTPNVWGAIEAATRIMPIVWERRPDARLAIIGKEPPREVLDLVGPRVTVTGFVEDIAPWLDRAVVALVPVRAGGGTRLKILEAINYGVPVVATSEAASGLGLVSGQEAVIANSDADLASGIVQLMDDPRLGCKMAAAARIRLARDFDWDVIGAQFERLLSDLIGGAA